MQFLLLALFSAFGASLFAAAVPLLGFRPFAYDSTGEALEKVYSIINANSTFDALHFDDGVPWSEALADSDFPAALLSEWDVFARHMPGGRKLYIGLAPLARDRKSLAPSFPGSLLPGIFDGAALNDPRVEIAWRNYVRRVVLYFNPAFLNLGIEAGELAARDPARWPQFVELFTFVRDAIKKDNPGIQIGISFGLQSLQKPKVSDLVKPFIEGCDYLGLSFYPYLSQFHEKFGEPALPSGSNAWRSPMKWVRSYTTKPIAFCETGCSTQSGSVDEFSFSFHATKSMQSAYTRDLVQITQRDQYLFVVWYLAVDYDNLYSQLPPDPANLLWRNCGFFDGKVRPKPAWNTWRNAVKRFAAAARN